MHIYNTETKLEINDNQFLLGGLAPDVHKSKSRLKEISHFTMKDNSGIGYVDYEAFYTKYLTKNKTPFHLGYYFHLISDYIWLEEIYYKKIKWLPKDIKIEAKRMYYRDFWRLNWKLIDYYSLELISLEKQPIDIDEIDEMLLDELIRDLETDFNMVDSTKGESLKILELEEAIGTIEKTVISCIANFKKVHGKGMFCLPPTSEIKGIAPKV